jgi:hypothetical protein
MLIPSYNKISNHREVGIPEAISNLLDFPNTLTGGVFEKIHTTHLLNHIKRCGRDGRFAERTEWSVRKTINGEAAPFISTTFLVPFSSLFQNPRW